GNLGLQLIAISFRQTACDDELLARAALLVLGHLQNRVDGLLFGGIDERAGIDHEHVGARCIVRDLVPRVAGQTQHDLGVDEVLGTAEGEKANLHRSGTNLTSYRREFDSDKLCERSSSHYPGPDLEREALTLAGVRGT